MAWITPKTDWVSTDYVSPTDYNRIKNNLLYVNDYLNEMFPDKAQPLVLGDDKSYASDYAASEFNKFEDALESFTRVGVDLNIGTKKYFSGNGLMIDYAELIRLETCTLRWKEYNPYVQDASIIPDEFELHIGETQQLTLEVYPSEAQFELTWSSSDTSKATVSSSGLVTGVSGGSFTITATINQNGRILTRTAYGRVIVPATGISLETDLIRDVKGTIHVVNVSFTPEGATDTDDYVVISDNSNPICHAEKYDDGDNKRIRITITGDVIDYYGNDGDTRAWFRDFADPEDLINGVTAYPQNKVTVSINGHEASLNVRSIINGTYAHSLEKGDGHGGKCVRFFPFEVVSQKGVSDNNLVTLVSYSSNFMQGRMTLPDIASDYRMSVQNFINLNFSNDLATKLKNDFVVCLNEMNTTSLHSVKFFLPGAGEVSKETTPSVYGYNTDLYFDYFADNRVTYIESKALTRSIVSNTNSVVDVCYGDVGANGRHLSTADSSAQDLQPMFFLSRDTKVIRMSSQEALYPDEANVYYIDWTGNSNTNISSIPIGSVVIDRLGVGRQSLIESATISPRYFELNSGQTKQLSVTIVPTDTYTITWNSSDTSVATVNSSGLVTAVAGGNATITATVTKSGSDESIELNAVAIVTTPATGISISPSTLTIAKGRVATLTVSVTPEGATDGESYSVSSSNPSIVSVSQSSMSVLATGEALGTATITVSLNGHTATANVTVSMDGSYFYFNGQKYYYDLEIGAIDNSVVTVVQKYLYSGLKGNVGGTSYNFDERNNALYRTAIEDYVDKNFSTELKAALLSYQKRDCYKTNGGSVITEQHNSKYFLMSLNETLGSGGNQPINDPSIRVNTWGITIDGDEAITKHLSRSINTVAGQTNVPMAFAPGKSISATDFDTALPLRPMMFLDRDLRVYDTPNEDGSYSIDWTGTSSLKLSNLSIGTIVRDDSGTGRTGVDIFISPASVSLNVGETQQLTTTVTGTTDYSIEWRDGGLPSPVATVSSTGLVTAVKGGEATIWAAVMKNGEQLAVTSAIVEVEIGTGSYFDINGDSNIYNRKYYYYDFIYLGSNIDGFSTSTLIARYNSTVINENGPPGATEDTHTRREFSMFAQQNFSSNLNNALLSVTKVETEIISTMSGYDYQAVNYTSKCFYIAPNEVGLSDSSLVPAKLGDVRYYYLNTAQRLNGEVLPEEEKNDNANRTMTRSLCKKAPADFYYAVIENGRLVKYYYNAASTVPIRPLVFLPSNIHLINMDNGIYSIDWTGTSNLVLSDLSAGSIIRDDTGTGRTGIGMYVKPYDTTLFEGETYTLEAVVEGVRDYDIAWTSSNTSVATVNSSGVVTAKKKGNANITAKLIKDGEIITESISKIEVLMSGSYFSYGGDNYYCDLIYLGSNIDGSGITTVLFRYVTSKLMGTWNDFRDYEQPYRNIIQEFINTNFSRKLRDSLKEVSKSFLSNSNGTGTASTRAKFFLPSRYEMNNNPSSSENPLPTGGVVYSYFDSDEKRVGSSSEHLGADLPFSRTAHTHSGGRRLMPAKYDAGVTLPYTVALRPLFFLSSSLHVSDTPNTDGSYNIDWTGTSSKVITDLPIGTIIRDSSGTGRIGE